MAGIDSDQLDIEVQGHTLTISGQNRKQSQEKNPNSFMSMNSYGAFSRTISLPEDADMTRMQTKKENNSLIITLPRKQAGQKSNTGSTI